MNLLCVGRPDVDWFSETPAGKARAAGICNRCSARQQCEEGARARGEGWGIWGGLDAAQGFTAPTAPADAVMITAEPTAHLRATVPMRHGSRSSYLLCRDGEDGRACAECRRANSEYQAGYRDHGPAVTRQATVDLQIPLFEGVAS